MPPHEKYVLKNGLTVLLLEKHGVPMINVFALLKTGSAADPSGQSGLASVTAGLLRKGTKGRTAQQFAADLDYIGGEFEAEAGADYSSVAAEFLTKDLERGLGLFSDAVLHPTFPQAEVDKLLAQSVDAVRGRRMIRSRCWGCTTTDICMERILTAGSAAGTRLRCNGSAGRDCEIL